MLHVVATIELKPGTRESWLAEFRKVVPLVHAEAGCIEYGVAVDIASGLAVQPPVRENVAVVIEKWADLAALKAHLAAPHMAEYRERVKEMITGVNLLVMEPV